MQPIRYAPGIVVPGSQLALEHASIAMARAGAAGRLPRPSELAIPPAALDWRPLSDSPAALRDYQEARTAAEIRDALQSTKIGAKRRRRARRAAARLGILP